MGIKQTIDADLKQALLSGDKDKSSILKVIKSVILDAEIAKNKRDDGLGEQELVDLLQKEAKKRDDTAEIYKKAADEGRENAEKAEADLIRSYLPEQMGEDEIKKIVDEVIGSEPAEMKDMGRFIGLVKTKTGSSADGATIARLVKEKIGQ
ncbi:MAG TPA: GatB/YqeY domain-containing protein [Candidatus Saccharibacteria bacterium]|nr:GatB/YqeY domain-containing protein [Candidatus Saccharibacteria bacterium]